MVIRIIATTIITHTEHTPTVWRCAYHEVTRKEFLEELCLFVLNSLDDELVITRHIEDRPAGSGVRQLYQWLVTQRILNEKRRGRGVCINIHLKQSKHDHISRVLL